MQHPASNKEPADYRNVSGHLCAQCGGSLTRTPERPIDHFWNLLVPVHRFRCGRFSCQWTGNLRVDARAADSGPTIARN